MCFVFLVQTTQRTTERRYVDKTDYVVPWTPGFLVFVCDIIVLGA